jgi:RNA polymerase sigma factor (sigma-70 family)
VAGDDWAAVYAGQYRRLVVLVSAVCGSVPEAEEAVQEAFVRALGLNGRRAVVDDPAGWLYRVAVNLLRSRWRRALVARRAHDRLAAEPEPTVSPDADVAQREELHRALRQLPFGQREALVLHYLADLPVETVAQRAGVPVGTVKARLHRGRHALAALLGDGEAAVAGGRRA